MLYRQLVDRYGTYFEGSMGAAAIQKRLESFDLEAEAESLRETIRTGKGQRKTRALKRLKVVNAFLTTTNSPTAMVLDAVPVIPPDLRPMVQLDGGRFATSDLNDLYRRVINRNNRLKRLLDLGAPEIIVNNEKRMLQEAVDSLFDNGRRGRPVTGPGNRPLKSISDMLKGKQGRFRQNLLGKRVDYSGRSVIVVGPQLKLHQCGLPKQMALELFKPFVMKRLVELNHAQNIKSAKRMVERTRAEVWDVLEEVIQEHPVLLNRAPHPAPSGHPGVRAAARRGQGHPPAPARVRRVQRGLRRRPDGGPPALSAEAQAEARILMLSSNNILKPSDGRPVTMPSQDMIIGLHHLTSDRPRRDGGGARVLLAGRGDHGPRPRRAGPQRHDQAADVGPRAPPTKGFEAPEGWEPGQPLLFETTLGRTIFNEALPIDYPFQNGVVGKKELSTIVNDLAERYPKVDVATSLDALKDAGYRWATRSGVTIAISDVAMPEVKNDILDEHEQRALKVQDQFDKGLITDDERRQELIEIWTQATDKIASVMRENLENNSRNTLYRMVSSGAVVTGCRSVRSPVCAVSWRTRRARSSRARSSPTTARACPSSSTSSPRTVPARVWPTRRCVPRTPAT